MDDRAIDVAARAIEQKLAELGFALEPMSLADDIAASALRAIDASGTHWVAPWVETVRMRRATGHSDPHRLAELGDDYAAMRIACLTERGKGEE